MVDQDAVVEPGWLEALIAALEANPRAGLVTSKVLLLDQPDRIHTLFAALTETHVQTTVRLKEILGEPADRMVSHKGTYLPATRLACDAVVNNMTVTSTALSTEGRGGAIRNRTFIACFLWCRGGLC